MANVDKHEEEYLHNMRHSCAHLLAAAVQELWPEVKLGVGPVIEHGLYYDFDLEHRLTEEDFPAIEKKMAELKAQGLGYEREEVSIAEAKKRAKAMKQPYKVELIETIEKTGSTAVAVEENGERSKEQGEKPTTVTFYTTGDFVDLCRGGHVESTKEIGPFKILSVAGAYWRGKSENPQLQRLYVACFATQDELDAHLAEMEEAKKRDHRKLGAELELFTFDPLVGPGLPLWLPKGTVLRDLVEQLAKKKEQEHGYQRVATPHVAKQALFEASGHLPYYADTMYPPMELDDGNYYLKAMNCPHMHVMFRQTPRSYRELPVRWAEYGTVYRYELSGTLAGLMRVRMLSMNDAHIYCREDQIEAEILRVMELHKYYIELFGIEHYYMRLSLHDPANTKKYFDEPKLWAFAEDALRRALDHSGLEYREANDEAAFYGPKIDFQVRFVGGREETIATTQLDFIAQQRFGLHYQDSDGGEKPIYVIHRAPLGTHERFVAFLIEHYAGKFPLWLAPVQVKLLPIADRHNEYATDVAKQLEKAGYRVELDDRQESVGKKIRTAQLEQVPYMLVVGDKEIEAKPHSADGSVGARQVAVRGRDDGDLGAQSIADFLTRLEREPNPLA
ncbi:threonine--tRNA ligase [Candidatus Berkelbacteria bacterium]|nr:threonine--tRNA ligase [Candidatus Berkelbacteria bacterium]